MKHNQKMKLRRFWPEAMMLLLGIVMINFQNCVGSEVTQKLSGAKKSTTLTVNSGSQNPQQSNQNNNDVVDEEVDPFAAPSGVLKVHDGSLIFAEVLPIGNDELFYQEKSISAPDQFLSSPKRLVLYDDNSLRYQDSLGNVHEFSFSVENERRVDFGGNSICSTGQGYTKSMSWLINNFSPDLTISNGYIELFDGECQQGFPLGKSGCLFLSGEVYALDGQGEPTVPLEMFRYVFEAFPGGCAAIPIEEA